MVSGGTDGVALLYPRGLAVSAGGLVVVTEPGRHRVRLYDPAGPSLRLLMGSPSGAACSGNVSRHCVREPWALAFADAAESQLLVCDTGNNRLLRLDISSGGVALVAGNGAGSASAAAVRDGQVATDSALVGPRGVAVRRRDGAVFVAEGGAHAIRAITRSAQPGGGGRATIATLVGASRAPGFVDGPPDVARLNTPGELALSADGAHLFIADTGNYALRRLTLATRALATLAGTGRRGFTPDGALARGAALTRPMGVVVGSGGDVVFSDSGYGVADANGGNSCVRAVRPDGTLVTVAGVCGQSPRAFSAAVPARQASLDEPSGLAARGDDLFLAAHGHHAIVQFAGGLRVPANAPSTRSRTRSRRARPRAA